MTKILGLLVVAVLVGLGAGDSVQIPPYIQYGAELVQAAKMLIVDIISMDGHIPFLNDPRRQFAEIVHVINYIGQKQTTYPYLPYNEVYYKYLNTSAAEGIRNPQNVIDEVKYLLDNVHNKSEVIKDLIDKCPVNVSESDCNKYVHDLLKTDPLYGVPALIFLGAGRAATEFNKHSGKFKEVSENLNANQYVCTSPNDMRVLVAELAYLYQAFNDLPELPPFIQY